MVMLSVVLLPVSLATVRSRPVGASAVVSRVTARTALARLLLPAWSIWLALRLCSPVVRATAGVMLQTPSATTAVPRTVVPVVSNRLTVAPFSPVPVIVGIEAR